MIRMRLSSLVLLTLALVVMAMGLAVPLDYGQHQHSKARFAERHVDFLRDRLSDTQDELDWQGSLTDQAIDLTRRVVNQSERWQFQAVKCQASYKRLARRFRRLQTKPNRRIIVP